ncbi:MAG: hypothetical protein PWP20_438 [Eubacteriaceae bacterium]|nr:hypothetical protein [Eubacteriaceae bacterium]
MLADNIVYLKKHNPTLLNKLNDKQSVKNNLKVIKEDTKSGKSTLKIEKDGQGVYLNSKYDPEREARTIIDRLLTNIEQVERYQVIFWGLGLGYHIEHFSQRFPNVDFSIFEPSIAILNEFLDYKLLKKISGNHLKLLQCGNTENEITLFFNSLTKNTNKEIIFCELPSYQKVFEKERTVFFEHLQKVARATRVELNTNLAFKRRWILNSVINFSEVLKSANILMQNKEPFKKSSAILVSAGPSLDLEIENLKRIKEEKLAYIFSVGSSINTLIENDIYPDAMCTYDPQGVNQKVYEKVFAAEITAIPMIFGSSVGFETLQRYQGPKLHMITSQDTTAGYFLKPINDEELVKVSDAPTIAVVTLELLQKLEFREIILVGQNLAFRNDAYYASGIQYENQSNAYQKSSMLEVESVTGEIIQTNESLNRLRFGLEARIPFSEIPVINTTVDGAAIKGTVFKRLEDIIHEYNGCHYTDSLDSIQNKNIYDLTYMQERLTELQRSFKEYKELVDSMKQLLIKTDELVINKNLKQSEMMNVKINTVLNELEHNNYFKVYAMPINRVEHELLAVNLKRIRKDKIGLNKIREQIAYMDAYINQLIGGFDTDDRLVLRLMQSIGEFIKKNKKDAGEGFEG